MRSKLLFPEEAEASPQAKKKMVRLVMRRSLLCLRPRTGAHLGHNTQARSIQRKLRSRASEKEKCLWDHLTSPIKNHVWTGNVNGI
jgi:hypothetical protein